LDEVDEDSVDIEVGEVDEDSEEDDELSSD
jgi:hypothetical protein